MIKAQCNLMVRISVMLPKYYEVDLSLLIKEVLIAPLADDWF